MNRHRYLAIAALCFATLTAPAQQPASVAVPSVEAQMKALTAHVSLSAKQQQEFKPILTDLHDATLKIVEDQTLSHDQMLEAVRPHRFKAYDQMTALLTADQKKKLDEYLQGPHNELHGGLTGEPSPQP